MGNKPKICLADDDLPALESTARLICAMGYSAVICQSRKELLREISDENVCCIVLEANMSDLNGPNFLEVLAFRRHCLPVIFTARTATVATGVEAMKAGAIDFLIKPVDPDRLIAAIHEAMRKYQKSCELAVVFSQFKSLTQREKEVFELVTTGLLNKQIAGYLGISEKTIKVHRGRVMEKMEVQSLAELVRLSDKLALSLNVPSGPVYGYQR